MERRVKVYPLPGFGDTLRKAREAKELTQGEVAEHVGVLKNMVSKWEREKNWLSDANLVAVCGLLGLEPPLPDRNAKGRRSTKRGNCPQCGKEFPRYHDEIYCSRVCAHAAASARPGFNWKGGKWVGTDGYIMVYRPDHPAAVGSGYVREHRLVMEEMIGRYLDKSEHVHHKNGDRADNRPENLELWANTASGAHRGVRVTDVLLEALRDEIRQIIREELIAAGVLKE